MLDVWKLNNARKIYVKIENLLWKLCECVILLNKILNNAFVESFVKIFV